MLGERFDVLIMKRWFYIKNVIPDNRGCFLGSDRR